jgi:hypothetical protein
VGIDLGDQEDLVAAPGDGLRHHLLRAALGVHLGRVDQRHAEVEAEPQRRRFPRAVGAAFPHLPGALAERWHPHAIRQTDHRHGIAPVQTLSSAA